MGLTSAENFEGLADLAELKVGLGHSVWVLRRVVSDSEDSELLGDVLVAGVGADSERLVIVFSHL